MEIKSTCKKLDEMAIKFVDSVDCSIQAKIEKNIEWTTQVAVDPASAMNWIGSIFV